MVLCLGSTALDILFSLNHLFATWCNAARTTRAARLKAYLAGDEPVEQMTDRGQPLLDAWRWELARTGLGVSAHNYL